MKVTKIDVTDAAALEKLVVEHIDRIEPGLSVIDARPMLGHATIDLVAQDAAGSLVLIALGFRAEENMLLRVVDAYSWCLEYPGTMQRHYPTLTVSEECPPRVVFVMSRVPESFQRKIKQLSFPSVDAVEFHHLDVDGQSTVFFDGISQIRRGVATVAPVAAAPDIAVRPVLAAVPSRPVIEPVRPAAAPVRLAAEISAILASNGNAPRSIEIPAVPVTVATAELSPETAAAAVEEAEEPVVAIAGGSDAAAAEIEAPVAEVEAPVAVAPAPEAEPTGENKYLFSEAAKATKIAQELGIKLPGDGPLTREWIDFLNQMAAK